MHGINNRTYSLACQGGTSVKMLAVNLPSGVSCQDIDNQIALLNGAECKEKNMKLQFDPARLCCPSSNDIKMACFSICTGRNGLAPFRTIGIDANWAVTCADAQVASDLVVSDHLCTDF
jgi:hypothetical protein